MATSTSVRKNLCVSFFQINGRAGVRALIGLTGLLLAVGALPFRQPTASATQTAPPGKPDAARVRAAFGQLPLRFEANAGRLDEHVRFFARGSQATLFLTAREAVLRLRGEDQQRAGELRLSLVNANRAPIVTGLDQLPSHSHYFTGRNASKWRNGVGHFGKVRYAAVYPGIDLVYYGQGQLLEYDFVVAPGADARRIRMSFAGARAVRLGEQGELVLQLAAGEVRQRPPVAYQEVDGVRRVIPARYRLYGKDQAGFTLGSYDRRRTLWIDPVLEYSTYLGGDRSDQGLAVAVDKDGNTYVAGLSDSTDFPSAGPIQGVHGAGTDAFIAKINARGTALIYAAYLGGNNTDAANAVALDAAGNVYLAGVTFSSDFPITTNAMQRIAAGGQESFVVKLAASGSELIYSTLLGGANSDFISGLAADAAGNAYFTGRTDSPGFAGLAMMRRGNPVMKTADRAQTWNGASNELTASIVSGLTVDPVNPDTLYAATNYGVFKSIDGGANWRRTGALVFSNTVAVDPVTPTTIYVGASFSVLKSANGGDSYESIFFDSSFGFPNILSLLIDPVNPSTLYAGTSRGAFKSTNGGLNWTPITNGMASTFSAAPRVNRLVFDPANPQTLYAATTNNLFKTTNGGTLWTPANAGLGTSTFVEVLALAVDPAAPSTLYAGVGSFNGALYKSTDGGATWRQSSEGISYSFGGNTFLLSANNLAIDPVTPATIYATTTSGGLFKSIDGGAQWNITRGSGMTNRLLTALAVDRAGLLYAGANIGGDAFLGKLNAGGSALGYFRYYGGSESDEGRGVAVDSTGAAYVIGATASVDLPTVNALQPSNRGFSTDLITTDAFVAKLNPAGTEFVYATYLGGNSTDQGRAIALDAAGNAYIAGNAASTDFPTVNAFKPAKSDFGFDLFVARLNAAGSALDFSTYLGGGSEDTAAALALDGAGNVYVTGTTASLDFPVINALQAPTSISSSARDVFLSKLSSQGAGLSFSTFLGGTSDELAGGIAVDAARNVYLTGATISRDFPTLNPLRPPSSTTEAFLAKFAPLADLGITAAALPNPVQANGRVSYTLTVINRGPDEAGEVILTDTLPAGLTNATATASTGACSGAATITCNLGELASGASATVTITATAPATGPLRNMASVRSNTPDNVTANNSLTQETAITTLPSISGRVTLGRAGLAGVTVSLSGGQTATRRTDSSGAYQFAELAAGGNYTVSANLAGSVLRPSRQDFNELRADQTANFTATGCNFAITPVRQSFAASGGTGDVTLTAPDSACAWTARSNAAWITITSAANGQGSGMVSFTVAATTVPRSGTLTIGDRVLTVQQEFEPCSAPAFRIARTVPFAGSPSDLVTGDFNGDGQADLLALNVPSGAASVLRGDGRGGFGAPEPVNLGQTTQTAPRSLAVADFNNDRRDDLAVVHESTGALLVLLSETAGGFSAPRAVNPDGRHLHVTAGNFNGDNRLDLLVLNSGSDSLAVLPGNGDGSFGAAITTNTAGFQRTAVVGDFNHDRHDDVVVLASSQTALFLSDGAGRFGAARNIGSSLSFISATTADFDRDGKLDLVAARSESSTGVVLLLRGDGTGAFAAPRSFNAGDTPDRIVAGDFNNDGLPDAAFNDDRLHNLVVLLGVAAGGFDAPVYLSAGTPYGGLAAADFNRDGNLDLAAPVINGASRILPAQISLLFSTGSDFIAARDTLLPQSLTTLAAGDFNGDGRQDVAVDEGDRIALRLSNTAGGFNAPAYLSVNAGLLEARDVNRDGRVDLIARGSDRLTLLLGNGRGEFTTGATTLLGANVRAVALEDFNRDGQLDLIAADSADQPALFLNNGQGGFGAASSTGAFGAGMNLNQFAAGDFNGDGNQDVLAATQPGCSTGTAAVIVFPGDGRGGFGPGVRSYVNAPPRSILTGDFNGDGRTDAVLAGGCFSSSAVALALGSSDGRLIASPGVTFENDIGALASGDLNSDGRPDLALLVGDTFSTFSGLSVQVMLASANGFSAPIHLGPVARALALATGDVNGDGRADLIAGGTTFATRATLTVILNDCRVARTLAHVSAASFSGTQFAAESIVAAFGLNLATTTQTAASLPLPTELAGTTVKVMDSAGVERLAPLYAVTPMQVNYLLPAGLALGTTTVTITSGDGAISTGTINIAPISPAVFAANATGQGVAAAVVLRVRADGSQSFEPVARFDAAQNRFVSVPVDLGPETDQVFLVAFGTGIRFRSALSAVSVRAGSLDAPVLFAGAQGSQPGVDQINARLLRELAGRGEVTVTLVVDGQTANTVTINIR